MSTFNGWLAEQRVLNNMTLGVDGQVSVGLEPGHADQLGRVAGGKNHLAAVCLRPGQDHMGSPGGEASRLEGITQGSCSLTDFRSVRGLDPQRPHNPER
jgi:hypothetical protein